MSTTKQQRTNTTALAPDLISLNAAIADPYVHSSHYVETRSQRSVVTARGSRVERRGGGLT